MKTIHGVRIVALLLVLGISTSCRTQSATTKTIDAKPLTDSAPVEKDGLAVTVRPLQATFRYSEPLAMEVTFRNVSKESLRLPDQPQHYGLWTLKCTEVKTGKTYTGGYINVITLAGSTPTPSKPIPAGETLVISATFQYFDYKVGDMDVDTFAKATHNFSVSPLPVGTYKIRVAVQYFLHKELVIDSVPVWKDSDVLTNPIEITIAP